MFGRNLLPTCIHSFTYIVIIAMLAWHVWTCFALNLHPQLHIQYVDCNACLAFRANKPFKGYHEVFSQPFLGCIISFNIHPLYVCTSQWRPCSSCMPVAKVLPFVGCQTDRPGGVSAADHGPTSQTQRWAHNAPRLPNVSCLSFTQAYHQCFAR